MSDGKVVKASGVGTATPALAARLLGTDAPNRLRSEMRRLAEVAGNTPVYPSSGVPSVDVVLLPTYAGPTPPLTPAYAGDVGVDLYAAADVTIGPQERVMIPTGIMIAVPDGYEAQVRPRSGNAIKRGLTVLNTPGTIDPGFRGEVNVIAFNSNPVITGALLDRLIMAVDGGMPPNALTDDYSLHYSTNTLRITKGDKIAQLVFARFERPTITVVSSLPDSERGTRGYGSSG